MVERICPVCQHGNPLDDRFCGKCGGLLERQMLARREEGALTIAGHQLPVTWRQVGKTAALGVAALAAEAGLAWLKRRIDSPAAPTSTALAKRPATQLGPAKQPASSAVTIISQRIVEIFESEGRLQINERHTWRRTEE